MSLPKLFFCLSWWRRGASAIYDRCLWLAWGAPLGYRKAGRSGSAFLRPSRVFCGLPMGEGASPRARRGATLSVGGDAASGGRGGEGGHAFTWGREDPEAHPGEDSSGALAGKRRRVRQGMLRSNRPGCRACDSQVPASVAAAESLPGGRAHSWPATRSCFPATASAVLWVPAKDASPSSRWLQRPAAALSPGDSSCPQPAPPHSPTRAPEGQGHGEGVVGSTLAIAWGSAALLSHTRETREYTNTQDESQTVQKWMYSERSGSYPVS